MDKNLERLIELQELDTQIAEIDRKLELFPAEIAEHLDACNNADEELKQFHTKMEELKKLRLSKEAEVESKQAGMAKAKTKLNDVKTNTEYSAVLAEIENMKKSVMQLEDDQLNLMERVEAGKEEELVIKRKVEEEKKEFDAIKTEKEGQMESLKAEKEGFASRRKELADGIEQRYLQHYDKIFNSREKKSVAGLSDGFCLACHQTIRPQMAVEVRTGTTIHTCPHCQRFLYFVEPKKEEKEQAPKRKTG